MVWRYETRDKMDAMQTNEKRKTSNMLPQELLAGITCRGWTSLCKHAQNATDFFPGHIPQAFQSTLQCATDEFI